MARAVAWRIPITNVATISVARARSARRFVVLFFSVLCGVSLSVLIERARPGLRSRVCWIFFAS
jgi:hypothetical protein